jgi:ABC-2 type transport system ATP-binding protein
LAVETIVYYIIFVIADECLRTKWFPAPYKWRKREQDDNSDEDSIDVERLTKKFGKEVAVDGISFSVQPGETLAIIGPNGAGKSSILGMIAGCREASYGRINFFGHDGRFSLEFIHKMTGFCPQDNLFVNELRATEWLNAVRTLRGISTYDYSEIFLALGLDAQIRSRIGDMSGGNKRKVCLAAALLCEPPVVVLDEATSGVDFTSRTRIWSLISGLENTTVIIATHTLEECEKIADRIMVVRDGKIGDLATPTELRHIFKCGYTIETEKENAERLKKIVKSHGVLCECEESEDRARMVIPAEEVHALAQILKDIDFKYLMAIQNLEEKIFSQIQDHEMEMMRRKTSCGDDSVLRRNLSSSI